jgi:biopolymer transport protein ExbD
MAMGGTGRGNGAIADINVTPMADIMIVLLITGPDHPVRE